MRGRDLRDDGRVVDQQHSSPDSSYRVIAGRYVLQARLGAGATGTVWTGTDEALHRPVAVKELRIAADIPADQAAELRARAVREARVMASVTHPNIALLYDVAWQDDTPFVVMELVPGQSLADVLDRNGAPLDERQLALVADGVAGALQAAHRIGIVHRDVQPGNVLVGDQGEIKLGDFGIARNGADPTLTKTGHVLGTPAFIAPEVAKGGQAGYSADSWSLGAMLFRAAEGRPVYDGANQLRVIGSILYDEVPRHHRTGAIGELISGLMVKDPAGRMPLEEVQRSVRPLLPEAGANPFEGLLDPDAAAVRGNADSKTRPISRGAGGSDREHGGRLPVDSPTPQENSPAPKPNPPPSSSDSPVRQRKPARRRRHGRTALLVLASVVAVLAGTAGGFLAGRNAAIEHDYSTGHPKPQPVITPSGYDAHSLIQAENYSRTFPGFAQQPTTLHDDETDEQVGVAGELQHGELDILFEDVNFGDVPATGIQLNYGSSSSDDPNLKIEFRLDDPDGPVIGAIPLVSTYSSEQWRRELGTVGISPVQGTHDVYLKGVNNDPAREWSWTTGQSAYLDWFTFVP